MRSVVPRRVDGTTGRAGPAGARWCARGRRSGPRRGGRPGGRGRRGGRPVRGRRHGRGCRGWGCSGGGRRLADGPRGLQHILLAGCRRLPRGRVTAANPRRARRRAADQRGDIGTVGPPTGSGTAAGSASAGAGAAGAGAAGGGAAGSEVGAAVLPLAEPEVLGRGEGRRSRNGAGRWHGRSLLRRGGHLFHGWRGRGRFCRGGGREHRRLGQSRLLLPGWFRGRSRRPEPPQAGTPGRPGPAGTPGRPQAGTPGRPGPAGTPGGRGLRVLGRGRGGRHLPGVGLGRRRELLGGLRVLRRGRGRFLRRGGLGGCGRRFRCRSAPGLVDHRQFGARRRRSVLGDRWDAAQDPRYRRGDLGIQPRPWRPS